MELTKEKINKLRTKIEQKNSVFAKKSLLDSMVLPSKLIGREKETEILLSHILSIRDGFLVPFVSVYGRSGSGKSTIVKFVCENLSDIVSSRFVNLRKAKTIFGCANIILLEIGGYSLKSAEGLNKALDLIQQKIKDILEEENKKFFVLVLDEYDVIFYDSRGNPSDFVYKLLQMEENLREQDLWLSIISISNNALNDYDLDDRVKSRMGSASVSFTPYSQEEVLAILQERAKDAFKTKISIDVLRYCSEISSSDHGDARRALDLLRTAGEMCKKTITKEDVILAQNYLQKDRAKEIVLASTYHMRCILGAICANAIVNEQDWSATSNIFKKYTEIVSKNSNPLSYRRVSDLLVELENSGLLVSRSYSKGRGGYGKEYKLKVSPDLVGPDVDKQYYDSLVNQKKFLELTKERKKRMKLLGGSAWKRYRSILGDI